jgi:hypothetical protein
MSNEVTLDWDIQHEDVRDSVSWRVLMKYMKDNEDGAIGADMRRSSSGNVHVRIRYSKELDAIKVYQIRALLRDDLYRLRLDLIRDYNKGETNRLWDFKIKNGEIHEAGSWEVII